MSVHLYPHNCAGLVVNVMFEFFTQAQWSPYVAGAGIGVLSCLAFLLSDRPIGCSTAFVKARGLIGKAIDPVRVSSKEYYLEIVPREDWDWRNIVGFWCPVGRWLHEWAWDQWFDPTLACQYHHGLLFFCRRDRYRDGTIPDHRCVREERTMLSRSIKLQCPDRARAALQYYVWILSPEGWCY